MLIASSEARASSLICGLTESEVESILYGYGATTTFQTELPWISAPFDCGSFGDLCNLVGPTAAEDFICAQWDQARDGVSATTATAAAESLLEELEQAWYDERFPDGVPNAHPWWGTFQGEPVSSCVTDSATAENDEKTRRVKGKAFFNNGGWIYRDIGSVSRIHQKIGAFWFPGGTGQACNDTYYWSSTTCSLDPDEACGVTVKFRRRIKMFTTDTPYTHVESDCSNPFLGLEVTVCKTATWEDTGSCG